MPPTSHSNWVNFVSIFSPVCGPQRNWATVTAGPQRSTSLLCYCFDVLQLVTQYKYLTCLLLRTAIGLTLFQYFPLYAAHREIGQLLPQDHSEVRACCATVLTCSS